MGKVACQTIKVGKGVCGAAAKGNGTTVLVKDVESFPGHIACDGDSRSEIVVPIRDATGVVSLTFNPSLPFCLLLSFFHMQSHTCLVLSCLLNSRVAKLGRRCHRY